MNWNRGFGSFAIAVCVCCAVGGELDAQARTMGPLELFTASVRAEGEILEPGRATDGWSMRADQIAWGEGTVSGELVGEIDFSLLAKKPRGDRPRDVLFVGWLFLPGGVEVMYEAEGWAVPSDSDPSEWFVTARLAFPEAGDAFSWLSTTNAAWVGSFHVGSGRGSFRVLAQQRTGG